MDKTRFRNAKIKNMKMFLTHSKSELKKYNNQHKIIHLQQACEKVYNSYIYMLEALSYTEIKGHREVGKIARQLGDEDVLDVGGKTAGLHNFFYEGPGSTFFTIRALEESYLIMKRIIKKKGLYVKVIEK